MQTLKTAIVVVLLLFVIYGGFVALNGTNTTLSPELEGLVGVDETTPDIGGVTTPFAPSAISPSPSASAPAMTASAGAADPWAAFNSTPSIGFSNSTTPPPAPPSLGAPPNLTPPPPQGAPIAAPSPLPTTLPPIVSPSQSGEASLPPIPATPASASAAPDFGFNLPDSKAASLPPEVESEKSNPLPPLPGIGSTDIGAPASESPTLAKSVSAKSYENAKETALQQTKRGQLKEALATLSVFYNDGELSVEQRQDLLDLLDALAREVVYSREHYLDIAYFSAPGETLEQIAKRFEIPADILARINAINPAGPLAPSTKLKVVPGPFRGEVDLTRNELTLFVGELYAGRYPITTGRDPEPKPGEYKVIDKQKDRNYYGNGAPILANDPRNPYGGYWIDLGQDLCIHGTSEAANPQMGCISLSPLDAADVFGMLASGSQITVRR